MHFISKRLALRLTIVTAAFLLIATAALAGPTQFYYDQFGRMVRMKTPDDQMHKFYYDLVGNRLATAAYTISVGTFVTENDCWVLDINDNYWLDWDPDVTPTGTYCFTAPVGETFDEAKLNDHIPVTGDWNGDGTTEFAEFDRKNGTWYLDINGDRFYNGEDPTNPNTDVTSIYGQLHDWPVSGDWDGDGKDEVGVFRAGTWYLDTNSNRTLDDVGISFGAAGDLPVTGDWNNDGTTKASIFRPGDGLIQPSLRTIHTPKPSRRSILV